MRNLSGILGKFGNEPINVLCSATHERYQSGFGLLENVNFHMIQTDYSKPWQYQYANLPKNHTLWPKNYFPYIRFDCCLSQNKYDQFPMMALISKDLNVPLISLEHCMPLADNDEYISRNKKMSGHINVFISHFSREKWKYSKDESIVIHHMVDDSVFYPDENINRENKILLVCNDFKNRGKILGYDIFQRITEGLPVTLIGDSPGLSKAAKNTEELADIYRSHKIFLNTSRLSPLPTVILEAMASGCAVVSTNNCMIPEVCTSGVNSLISNIEEELREFLVMLLKDDNLANRLGKEARRTVQEKFSKKAFIQNWSSIFNFVRKM